MFVFDPRIDWNKQPLTTAPGTVAPGVEFNAWSWSPDGTELAGTAELSSRSSGALVI